MGIRTARKENKSRREAIYHEERIGRLDESLELVPPLLELGGRVQQIDVIRENLISDARK